MEEKRKKDLCPEFPGIWYEHEICAILSPTGDGKSLLAETIAIAVNERNSQFTAYLDDHNGSRIFDERAGESPYVHYKDVCQWPKENLVQQIADYISWTREGIIVDLACPSIKDATIIGDVMTEVMASDTPNSALVTVQRGAPDSRDYKHILVAFNVQHVSFLEYKDGKYIVTTGWGTADAMSYELKVETKNGVRFVRA